MGARGLHLLQLAAAPLGEREPGWSALCRERNPRATVALLKDYERRGFVTTTDYETMQLTIAGVARMKMGEQIEEARELA